MDDREAATTTSSPWLLTSAGKATVNRPSILWIVKESNDSSSSRTSYKGRVEQIVKWATTPRMRQDLHRWN